VDVAPWLSRRAFLGAGLAVAGGVALGGVTPAWAASDKSRVVAIPFSSDLYASPNPQRFTLVLQQGTSDGVQYVAGPALDVRFRAPGSAEWTPYVRTQLDRAGLPKGRGVYRMATTFAQPGNWDGQARFSGTTTKFKMTLPAAAVAPEIGEAAPRAASPTRQTRSASTRSAPACRSARCTRCPWPTWSAPAAQSP